jgi:hypothetical protein
MISHVPSVGKAAAQDGSPDGHEEDVARTAPAAADVSIVRPDRPSSSVRPDPELHQKEESATSAGSRRERVRLLTDHVPVGARHRRAKG